MIYSFLSFHYASFVKSWKKGKGVEILSGKGLAGENSFHFRHEQGIH